jgi:hypothetical protein
MDIDHEAAAKEFGNQYFKQQQQQLQQQSLRMGPETIDSGIHEPRPANTGSYYGGNKLGNNNSGNTPNIFQAQHGGADGRDDESKEFLESKQQVGYK